MLHSGELPPLRPLPARQELPRWFPAFTALPPDIVDVLNTIARDRDSVDLAVQETVGYLRAWLDRELRIRYPLLAPPVTTLAAQERTRAAVPMLLEGMPEQQRGDSATARPSALIQLAEEDQQEDAQVARPANPCPRSYRETASASCTAPAGLHPRRCLEKTSGRARSTIVIRAAIGV